MMNLREIRDRSLAEARRLGYQTNPHLPLLDEEMSLRPIEEVIDRCLALNTVVSYSYGFERASAIDWLEKEGLIRSLVDSERAYLVDGIGDELHFNVQVEGVNAFAWSLNIVESLDFGDYCVDDLVTRLPDLKVPENPSAFRTRVELRSLEEIVSACDLAYCLDWAVVEASLRNTELPGPIYGFVITERRRALEWILGTEDWDEVPMDT